MHIERADSSIFIMSCGTGNGLKASYVLVGRLSVSLAWFASRLHQASLNFCVIDTATDGTTR